MKILFFLNKEKEKSSFLFLCAKVYTRLLEVEGLVALLVGVLIQTTRSLHNLSKFEVRSSNLQIALIKTFLLITFVQVKSR